MAQVLWVNLHCKVLGSTGTGGGFVGVPDPGLVGVAGFVVGPGATISDIL